MSTFTNRQRKAWADVTKTLNDHGIFSPDPEQLFSHWHVRWSEETRPGRGHHFDGTLCDGEHFVQVLMDVYGYPTVSIAALDWIHADSDEELECEKHPELDEVAS